MCLTDLEGETNFTLQNQSALKGQKLVGFVCSPLFFSPLFSLRAADVFPVVEKPDALAGYPLL